MLNFSIFNFFILNHPVHFKIVSFLVNVFSTGFQLYLIQNVLEQSLRNHRATSSPSISPTATPPTATARGRCREHEETKSTSLSHFLRWKHATIVRATT